MNIDAFLVISRPPYGSLRILKSRPSLNSEEIALKLKINIPNVFFERLMPVIKIELPESAVINTDMEAVIEISAPQIAEKLNLEVVEVEDGLRQMLTKKDE